MEAGAPGQLTSHALPRKTPDAQWNQMFDDPVKEFRDAVTQTTQCGSDLSRLEAVNLSLQDRLDRARTAMAAVLQTHAGMLTRQEHAQALDTAVAEALAQSSREGRDTEGGGSAHCCSSGSSVSGQPLDSLGSTPRSHAREHQECSPDVCEELCKKITALEAELHLTEKCWAQEVHQLQQYLIHLEQRREIQHERKRLVAAVQAFR
ncbi:hypothetical protein ACKKBF_B08995 [Auxenochlorella protothecoides x Auxenochlorella symbiontica]